MLIRMLTGLAGPGYVLGPGDEHEFEDREAVRLIEAGFAVPVAEQRIERAVMPEVQEWRDRKSKRRHVVSSETR